MGSCSPEELNERAFGRKIGCELTVPKVEKAHFNPQDRCGATNLISILRPRKGHSCLDAIAGAAVLG
jgi:hypothetical protein